MIALTEYREVRHAHFFAGLGGGAKGFNKGHARVGNMEAHFRCIGGIDVNPAAIRDFERLAGVKGTVLDLFDREQYRAFHGCEPPLGWSEVTIDDIRRAFGYENPHILFLSPPCKGLSALLSEKLSKSAKYQALNRLVVRGLFLALEAFKDDLPEFILIENVPRILTRGRSLLDQVEVLLSRYGYASAESTHDCGELGALAESRKRFLLVGRNVAKVPPFLYEPEKRPLKGVGEVLSKLPMPGDPRGGPMHRLPQLSWKTWVRLAFVEAGSDWRSLNKLNVVDGKLADYALVREKFRNDYLGVVPWSSPSGTITGGSMPTRGRFAVADPRPSWERRSNNLCVEPWNEPSKTIIGGGKGVQGGWLSVADPRFDGQSFGNYGVRAWDQPSATVTSQRSPGQGPFAVADPRRPDGSNGPHFNNVFRVVKWDEVSPAVTGGGGPSAGGLGIADPRFNNQQGQYSGKYSVMPWDLPSTTITGSDRIGSGALCVADPRPTAQRVQGDAYLTNGNYGVVAWDQSTGAISASACCDNGRWSVADPRIPEPNEKLETVIIAADNTFHRPFSTLELAALQSLIDPEDLFDLDGKSDGAKRERIGNAVPPDAAAAIASTMGKTLLLAWSGETFALSSTAIWVRPLVVALSVDTPFVDDVSSC